MFSMFYHFAKLAILIAFTLTGQNTFSQTTWNITQGWNLLGNHSIGPLDVTYQELAEPAKVNSIWTWNNATGKWAFYSPSLSRADLAAYAQAKGFEVLTRVAPKDGFWINANAAFTLTSYWNKHGDTLALYDLQKGWNLLGVTFDKSPNQLFDVLKPNLYAPDKVIASAWVWDSAQMKWRFYAPALDQSGGLSEYVAAKGYLPFSTPVSLGGGYWINVVEPNLADLVSVPIDIKEISYPDSYLNAPTKISDINSDPCNLDLKVVTFPRTWLGKHSLPTVKGAPLKAEIVRGVFLKDILAPDNPAFVGSGAPNSRNGCKGNLRSEFRKTIARIKGLGVDYAYMVQWHWASLKPDGSWYIVRAEDVSGALGDEDLKFFVDEAHAAGLKIYMSNQIQGMASGGQAFTPDANQDNFKKWLTAYKSFMIERSSFFQSIGIDLWAMNCGCFYQDEGDRSADAVALFQKEYKSIITEVRKVYRGMTSSYVHSWMPSDPEYLKQIDVLEVGVNTVPPNLRSDVAFSFDYYKTALDDSGFISMFNSLKVHGKPIMIVHGIQSRSDAMTRPGYMEETVCTSDVFGTLNGSLTECIQRATLPDFSIQAIVHEAAFELIGGLSNPAGLIVFVADYWETDPLVPQTAYPNIGASVRNKPAEGVVKAWFKR